MRVLVLHSHPVEESYGKALYRTTLDALAKAGHEVDACDLYAEQFDPVLRRMEDHPELFADYTKWSQSRDSFTWVMRLPEFTP